MKASVLSIYSDCHLVDVTHEIPPQDVRAASRVLQRTALRFPKGSVHLGVVDPGVGTDRPVVAARIAGHYFVAPDNGLLTGIIADHAVEELVEIDQSTAKSRTFHGRDVMAPAAARIATGELLSRLGVEVQRALVVLESPMPVVYEDSIETSISAIDHFGNASLAGSTELEAWLERAVAQRWTLQLVAKSNFVARDAAGEGLIKIQCCRTYGDHSPGDFVLLRGSQSDFEIAVVNGSAADQFVLTPGQAVCLRAG